MSQVQKDFRLNYPCHFDDTDVLQHLIQENQTLEDKDPNTM